MEASNAYTIANVLQAAHDLRERGAISAAAHTALTAPLSRHDAAQTSVLSSAPAQSASSPAPPSTAASYASRPTPTADRTPAPPHSASASASASAPASPPATSEGRPSVAALKARLGGLTTPSAVPVPRSAAAGARGVNGVPKRAPPPAPAKRASPPAAVEEKREHARASWDYAPGAEDELGFRKGDLLVVADRTTTDWWKGHRVGATGSDLHDRLFPANYVELVQVPALPPRRPTTVEKDPPPSYGALSTPVSASVPAPASVSRDVGPRIDYYTGAPLPGQPVTYPPPSGAGGYGGYGHAAPVAGGSYYAADASGTQRDSDATMQARRAKFGKMANSNIGQAAAGGLAFGAAAGIVGGIL